MELDKSLSFMIKDMKCQLRTLQDSDVDKEYVNGLKQQTKYIKNIPRNVNVSSQKKYINDIPLSKGDTICGLFINKKLVGTTGIQSSILFLEYIDNPPEYVATVGIFIFNNSYRDMGLGKVLVWAASYIFHNFTQSEWFGAGMEKENITSLKSFLSCGFQLINENNEGFSVLLNISELKKPIIIDNVRIQKLKKL